MGSGVPLLNEYKQEFLWKRLPQTILGGPKLRLGYDAPCYIYLNQVILFQIPWIIGEICTALVEYQALTFDIGIYITSSTVCVFVLIVNILSYCIQRKQAAVSPVTRNAQNILAEEDEIDFTSCCAVESVTFAVPGKKYVANIVVHALLSGVLCGLGFWYVLPTTLRGLYQSTASSVILHLMGWFSLSTAQYSLTVAAPPEPATFKTDDTYEITPLMRPFYCALCFTIDLIARYSNAELMLTNQITHVVFVLLPLLWMGGFLPPLDALLPWVCEQSLVILFGGSPMASNLRLLVMFVLSVGFYLILYYIPHGLATCVLVASFGYLLSTDLGALGTQLLDRCLKTRAQPNQVFTEENPGFLWKWTPREFVFHFMMMVLVGGLAGVLNCFVVTSAGSISNYFAYGVIAAYVMEEILSQVQSVYVFFGLWRNKFYPSSVQRTTIFQKRKAKLNVVGYIRRIIISAVGPFLMLVYLSLSITFISTPVSDSSTNNGTGQVNTSYSTAARILGANRAFRWIWQSSQNSLLEISFLHILNLALPASSTLPWQQLGTGLQLLILSLLRDRFTQLFHKLYFFFTLLISSWTDKKQWRTSTVSNIFLNLLLFPVVFCIITMATVLSAPLLPLFTLPVFFWGFPRPLQSWPGRVGASANTCPDTVYYRHIAPKLALALRVVFANGSMGKPSVGAHYLVRFQDRLIWVQVLEQGYLYTSISIKGLELQETSCHTVEAARIDDIFNMSFEREKGFSWCVWNSDPLNVLRPYDATTLRTYSDARTQLTGVIDSPESLRLVTTSFIQGLVWLLLHHCHDKKRRGEISYPQRPITPGKDAGLVARRRDSARTWEKLDEDTPTDGQISRGRMKNSGIEFSNQCDAVTSRGVLADNNEKLNNNKLRPTTGKSGSHNSHQYSPSVKSLSDSWESDNESLILEPLESKIRPGLVSGVSNQNLASGAIVCDDVAMGQGLLPLKVNHPLNTHRIPAGIPGFMEDTQDGDLFSNLGMPAVDIHQDKAFLSQPGFSAARHDPHSARQVELTTLEDSLHYGSLVSRLVSPPLHWRELPVERRWLDPLLNMFPKAWYHHIISVMKFDGQPGTMNIATEIAADTKLEEVYRKLVMACYAVVNVMGYGVTDTPSLGPNHVYKVYSGDIPWSAAASWIQDDPELKPLVLKAYRYGVKLAIDQAVLGEVSTLEDLQEYMEHYDSDCYIGLETDPTWTDAILGSKPNLFSLSYSPTQGTFSSRVLTLQDVVVAMGSVSKEAVRGQWANLALELLYMTNDDEERNSIQAHATVLRNLTVQAADPPLGYPIYASQPISVPTL